MARESVSEGPAGSAVGRMVALVVAMGAAGWASFTLYERTRGAAPDVAPAPVPEDEIAPYVDAAQAHLVEGRLDEADVQLTKASGLDDEDERVLEGLALVEVLRAERVCALGAELGVEHVVCILDQNMNYLEGDVFGTDLCRRLRGEFAWRGALLIQSANCETSDVRDYLQAGADGALDKGVSAALQTDILARVYHDRFPDGAAGAAPKRARRDNNL